MIRLVGAVPLLVERLISSTSSSNDTLLSSILQTLRFLSSDGKTTQFHQILILFFLEEGALITLGDNSIMAAIFQSLKSQMGLVQLRAGNIHNRVSNLRIFL